MQRHILAAAVLALTGCVTTPQARLAPLSPHERATLTCEQLDAEIEAAAKFCDHLQSDAGQDVESFLLDFGVGNAQERAGARASARIRIRSCLDAKREKGCEIPPQQMLLGEEPKPQETPAAQGNYEVKPAP